MRRTASLENPLPHDGAANSRVANITSHEEEATPFRVWHATPPAAGLSLIPPIHVRSVREKRARLPDSVSGGDAWVGRVVHREVGLRRVANPEVGLRRVVHHEVGLRRVVHPEEYDRAQELRRRGAVLQDRRARDRRPGHALRHLPQVLRRLRAGRSRRRLGPVLRGRVEDDGQEVLRRGRARHRRFAQAVCDLPEVLLWRRAGRGQLRLGHVLPEAGGEGVRSGRDHPCPTTTAKSTTTTG
jgi:hypothetical protein